MHQANKGNQWYYEMQVHIGVVSVSGLIHSLGTTALNVHDLTTVAELLVAGEEVVYADVGYQGIAKRPKLSSKSAELRVVMRLDKRGAVPDTLDRS